nr:hypothetical protein [Tanacetum cinerariifolium]
MQTRYLLAIQQLTKVGFPGVGAKSVRQLYDLLPSETGAIDEAAAANQVIAAYEQLRKLPRNSKFIPLDREGFSRAVEQADTLLANCKVHGVETIGCDDLSYPSRLLTIEDRPLVIYAKGNLSALNPTRAVAFVGTREPSDYGRKADGVVVLETDVKGGTMHTVKFTQLQRRTLACFKHPPKYADHPKAQGNQLLLREGKAMPLGSPEEINAFLAHLGKVPEKRAVVSHSIASNQPTLF